MNHIINAVSPKQISMIRQINFLLLFVFFSTVIYAQDKPKIWQANREFHYQALYIDTNGDTISNETIVMVPSGKPNPLQKNKQSLAEYHFQYSATDSAKLAGHPIHANDFTKKYNTIIWRRQMQEGIIENEDEMWMHPFRTNQYVLTEIAPFPAVRFPLTEGLSWKSLFFIAKGWGTFRGRATQKYTIKGKTTRQVGIGELAGCQLIEAVSKHKKLGESHAWFYFHPDYGFVEMVYQFYNGQQIIFSLQEIIN